MSTVVSAFQQQPQPWGGTTTAVHSALFMSTVAEPDIMAPSKEQSPYYDEDLGGSAYDDDAEDIRKHGPLEWLEDNPDRNHDDPFHLILLGETYDRPKITVPYVVGSLQYVLEMPLEEANEASLFAKEEGMACLGTWEHEDCLKLGRQLRLRDLLVRVVPYTEGGQRGWQAKGDGSNVGRSNKSNERIGSGGNDGGGFVGFE